MQSEIGAVDYVGVDHQTGKHLMGVAQVLISQTELSVDPSLQWSVPSDWTMEDAATVPLYYSIVSMTIWYHRKLFSIEMKHYLTNSLINFCFLTV